MPPVPRALAAYRQHAPDPIDERVNQHAPLVKKLAYHLVGRLPVSVEADDLIQAGLIGLMEAARHFDPAAGVLFETYASQRIKGAMLDELRAADWLPRQVRRDMKRIEAAIAKLEQRLGRPPIEQELAEELGMALSDYQTLLLDCRGHPLVHYDQFDDEEEGNPLERFMGDEKADPLAGLADSDFRRILVDGIGQLPEREQLVMALYYDEELNLKEIGAVLGVSESRVCQLHSQAIGRLRNKLKDWLK